MFNKNWFFVFVVSFYVNCSFLLGTIENSIIPLIEKFEIVENLPQSKYTNNQFEEISEVLKEKSNRIRIASYNVLTNLYDYKQDACNQWNQRLGRVVQLIEEMQPDILCIQELYNTEQVDTFSPFMMPTYQFYAQPCEDGELNGIFYRKERFELLESKVWYMTTTPEIPNSETLTMVKLKDRTTGRVVAIFNTHLCFCNINKREFQARFIASKIADYAKQIPVIFAGDLNTFSNRLNLAKLPHYDGEYIHRIFTASGLKDCREIALLGHLGPIGTFTNANEDGIPFTGHGTPGIMLDHIYASTGIAVLIHAVQSATVDGHFPSDHMPILADFLIR